MTTDDKPAPHPAPLGPHEWNVTAVEVARGEPFQANVAIRATCHADYTGRGEVFPVALLREIVQAAPEMVKLLHEWKGHPGYVHGDCDCLYCRTIRVLGRLDEAYRIDAGKAKGG